MCNGMLMSLPPYLGGHQLHISHPPHQVLCTCICITNYFFSLTDKGSFSLSDLTTTHQVLWVPHRGSQPYEGGGVTLQGQKHSRLHILAFPSSPQLLA
jgi:hypothetical protein